MHAATRIALLDHVGGGNLGDDATLEAVTKNIKRRWPNVEVVAFSMNPGDTETRHRLPSYPIRRKGWSIGYNSIGIEQARLKEVVKVLTRKFRAAFYLLRAANAIVRLPNDVVQEVLFSFSSRRILKCVDVLIITGGGQLTEIDGPWGFPYAIFKWITLARSAGVKCIFLNVGAGPLTHPISKFFVTRALLAADYVSLRDKKSQALLNEIGFIGESRVFPDSVYSLDVATINERSPQKRAQPIVGFAPMPYSDPRNHTAGKGFIRKLASFGSWLLGQSYALSLFGTDIGVDPFAVEDLQLALLTHHNISSSQYTVNNHFKSAQELLTTISGMDYVVTCRFHGVVFAHLLNKPVLAIGHHPKVMDIMADLELSRYCVDMRDFDLKLLQDRFASMIANAEEIKGLMAARLRQNRHRLRRQFDELFRGTAPQLPSIKHLSEPC